MAGNTAVDGAGRPSRRKAVWSTAALLWLIPLVALQLTDEVDLAETVAYGVILFGAAGAYEVTVALRKRNSAYRLGAAVALAAAFLLVWVNGAVGIIGNEGQPANRLYSGVIALGLIGALVSRFQPRGLSRVLIVVAVAQALIPPFALTVWPQVSWGGAGMRGVFILNAFFVMLFIVSAVAFRRAATIRRERGSE